MKSGANLAGVIACVLVGTILTLSLGRHSNDSDGPDGPPSHGATRGPLGFESLRESLEVQKRINLNLARDIVRARKECSKKLETQRSAADVVGEAPVSPIYSAADETHVTAVLMSWPKSSRFHLLRRIVEYVRRWSIIYEVLLVWNGDESSPPPPEISALVGPQSQRRGAEFRILYQKHNKIDNRWRIGEHIRTSAVLNLDDDVNLTQAGGECLFSIWRQSPHAVVGIDVRSHTPRLPDATYNVGEWSYTARDKSRGYKQYSIMLPRALLTHRDHYLMYESAQQNPTFRRVVDSLLCDDIAFNFVVANATQLAPIYAKAQYYSFPESHHAGALFREGGMKEKRQRCVNDLQKLFGSDMALQHRFWHVVCSVDG